MLRVIQTKTSNKLTMRTNPILVLALSLASLLLVEGFAIPEERATIKFYLGPACSGSKPYNNVDKCCCKWSHQQEGLELRSNS